ncbi:hypothetical protein [Bdellovibrio reynosensis]|uniref:Lipoprotein n=1 Tax=Bdellovibrio reynosensis TaxID=2835041 RepID=A0ABY4CEN5_9BACT|nr:hypothetical protein [Bdellovibrio reynosensis]UOF02131.1 hypothetical protein MNR06_04075 [Bdellovibrio reynosensis]
MNPTFFNKSVSALLLTAVLFSGCAKKETAGTRVAGRGNNVTQTTVPTSPYTGDVTCSKGAAGTGTLYTTEVEVLGLISATLDPKNFQGICKANFSATLKFDTSGNVVKNGSAIFIQIVDSLVGQMSEGQVIKPYEINFTNAVSGHYDTQSRTFEVRFEDSFGTFDIQGQVVGGEAQGHVVYENKVRYDNGTPESGTLGSFRIPVSALFK